MVRHEALKLKVRGFKVHYGFNIHHQGQEWLWAGIEVQGFGLG